MWGSRRSIRESCLLYGCTPIYGGSAAHGSLTVVATRDGRGAVSVDLRRRFGELSHAGGLPYPACRTARRHLHSQHTSCCTRSWSRSTAWPNGMKMPASTGVLPSAASRRWNNVTPRPKPHRGLKTELLGDPTAANRRQQAAASVRRERESRLAKALEHVQEVAARKHCSEDKENAA